MAATLLGAPPAEAASGERRHLRESRVRQKAEANGKLGGPRSSALHFSDGKLTLDTAGLRQSAEGALADSSRVARSVSGGVRRTLAEVRSSLARPPAHLRASAPAVGGRSVVVVTGRDGATALQVVPARGGPAASPPLGWLLLALGLAALLTALRPGRRGGLEAAGRWVRDRSLGGRLVRVQSVEAPPAPPPPSARWKRGAGAAPPAPSPLDAGEEGAGSPGGSRKGRTAEADDDSAWLAPAWWQQPGAALPVSAARLASGEAEARAALGRLNSCRVGGRQYDPADFLALRAACSASGVTLEVTAGETARDALFRGAVEAALEGASLGARALGGMGPAALLSGLALDMRLPRRRAATLVAAGTAARLRGMVLDGLAQLRRGEQLPATMQLMAMAAMLRELPMAPKAPELELVATSLETRTSAGERQQLLQLYAAANGAGDASAGSVAEALGEA